LAVALELLVRRTSVQPEGAVMVAVFGLTAIDATITSVATVPVGLLIARLPDATPFDAAARKAMLAAAAGVLVLPSSPNTSASASSAVRLDARNPNETRRRLVSLGERTHYPFARLVALPRIAAKDAAIGRDAASKPAPRSQGKGRRHSSARWRGATIITDASSKVYRFCGSIWPEQAHIPRARLTACQRPRGRARPRGRVDTLLTLSAHEAMRAAS
jgi:hypothetical protein